MLGKVDATVGVQVTARQNCLCKKGGLRRQAGLGILPQSMQMRERHITALCNVAKRSSLDNSFYNI